MVELPSRHCYALDMRFREKEGERMRVCRIPSELLLPLFACTLKRVHMNIGTERVHRVDASLLKKCQYHVQPSGELSKYKKTKSNQQSNAFFRVFQLSTSGGARYFEKILRTQQVSKQQKFHLCTGDDRDRLGIGIFQVLSYLENSEEKCFYQG